MKVDHALRDLYDHERTVTAMAVIEYILLSVAYIAVALEQYGVYVGAILTMLLMLSAGTATVHDGYNRAVWSRIPGVLDGVPLKTKREALEPYTISDEHDLEDLEQ